VQVHPAFEGYIEKDLGAGIVKIIGDGRCLVRSVAKCTGTTVKKVIIAWFEAAHMPVPLTPHNAQVTDALIEGCTQLLEQETALVADAKRKHRAGRRGPVR
jgi:hypothetical protein